MDAEIHHRLHAVEAARNIHRAWSVSAGRDLFGAWLIHTRHGRIGCPGRLIVRSVADEAAARRAVARALRRRDGAPRRIGVAYCDIDDVT